MFAEDLSVFFNAAEFACTATLASVAGVVIFDEAGTLIEDLGLQAVEPTALCPAAQWPAAAEGQTLVITLPGGARSFVVRGVAPVDDGALKMLTLARM